MIVAPEISNLTNQSIQISGTTSNPIIAKRSAETVSRHVISADRGHRRIDGNAEA